MVALTLFCVFVSLVMAWAWVGMAFLMPRLERRNAPRPTVWPRLSVIVPVRNEDANLERALRSLLGETYPELELLVIDDRSDDNSPQILARLQKEHPQLNVRRVEALPQGWLGKNHALQTGFLASQGELVLFTDADIVFKPGTLEIAVATLLHEEWDHLSCLFDVDSPSPVMRCVNTFFGIMFVIFIQPWRVSDPKSKAFLGVGGFNLLRRRVLEDLRGLEQVKMRPDDDLKLGKLVKAKGYRQVCLSAIENLYVEWYPSLRVCIRAFEKNMFAGFDYSLPKMIVGTLACFLVHVVPTFIPWFATGIWQAIGFGAVALIYLSAFGLAKTQGTALWTVLFFVPSALVMVYILIRTTFLNLSQGGLQWRDTFYKLEDLKKNKV